MTELLSLDRFFAAPHLSGLRLSPDGRRLVVAVSRPGPEPNKTRTAIWQVDPAGLEAPRRLTQSSAGESTAEFGRGGSLLFVSSRPDPDAKPDPDKEIAALWHLPANGGEAELLFAPEGGVDGVRAARHADVIGLAVPLHPLAAGFEDDAAKAKARKEAGVEALLFEDLPIRYWDHWLAPRRGRIFAARLSAQGVGAEKRLEPVDLTGDPGPAFLETDFDISPDGRTLVTGWYDWSRLPATPCDLVAIDVETKARRKLTPSDAYYGNIAISPDGRTVACVRSSFGSPDQATSSAIWLVDLSSGEGRSPAPGLEAWPEKPVWAPDSSALFFAAPRLGHEAAYRLDIDTGAVTCLVAEGSLSELCPSPDGETIYALQASMTYPARIVRFASRGENQVPVPLARGIDDAAIEGRGKPERVSATAADGTTVWSWLVLPPDAGPDHPAPLVVMAHGGPMGTWNGWAWRWNPHLFVERGYAVLMPDPAISLGYGQRMVDRGWGRWGETPFTDIMAATDAALTRPDLDASRTALAGASFGGYMANWVAGHTDRFKAIVTHASLWDLRPFHGTTDTGVDWEHEMGDPYAEPERYDQHSPAGSIGQFRTPMLVTHGERDFRVPVGEGIRLWTDLRRHGIVSRFLYFPDENHWILRPNNSRLWYETVLAFLDEHVLGKDWVRPELL